MVWLKVSDTAAMHPVVLAPLAAPAWPIGDPDPVDVVNLLYGLVNRCATHSAGYTTDYVVSDGTVAMMGGRHWRHWAEQAERAGYWTRVEVDGQAGWRILDDASNFVHIRLKAEIEWERQRRKDASDTGLIVPVRLRDGDECRYCRVIVNWSDRKSGRGGTYDHRVPGQGARTPDDLRVACQGCNGFRSNYPDADERRPARPAPATPFYGPQTAAMLAKHGYHVPVSTVDLRPGSQPDTATSGARAASPVPPQQDPASSVRSGTRPDTARAPSTTTNARSGIRSDTALPAASSVRSTSQVDTARTPHQDPPVGGSADPADRPVIQTDHRHAGSGSPGRVRDGPGREPPSPPPAVPGPGDTPSPRRGRRSRRRAQDEGTQRS